MKSKLKNILLVTTPLAIAVLAIAASGLRSDWAAAAESKNKDATIEIIRVCEETRVLTRCSVSEAEGDYIILSHRIRSYSDGSPDDEFCKDDPKPSCPGSAAKKFVL